MDALKLLHIVTLVSETKLNKDETLLTLKDPFISESCIEIKIELNFYFHTSLWYLKSVKIKI